MKTFKTILLAGVVGMSMAFAGAATAGEVFLSPRAKANQIVHVASTTADVNLAAEPYAGATTRLRTTFHSMVASGPAKDINMVSGNYLGAAAKSPYRDLRGMEFRIAPLIEKRNQSQK